MEDERSHSRADLPFAIRPRLIARVASLNAGGMINLTPFSSFNAAVVAGSVFEANLSQEQ
jgi:hypothetical protein